jgi:hypothetical protein
MHRRGFISAIVAAITARFARPVNLAGMSQAEYRYLRSFGPPPALPEFAPITGTPTCTLLTPSAITREAIMLLEKSLQYSKARRNYAAEMFAQAGPKLGTTLELRTPPRFLPPVSIRDQKNITIEFTLAP